MAGIAEFLYISKQVITCQSQVSSTSAANLNRQKYTSCPLRQTCRNKSDDKQMTWVCSVVQLEALKATTETKEVTFKIAYGLPLDEMLA